MSQINTFSRDSMRQIAREIFREARESEAWRIQSPPIQPHKVNSVQFINKAGGVEIPPYAVMRITGCVIKAGVPVFTVAKPSSAFQRLYLVNGPLRVGAGSAADDFNARGVGTWLDEAGPVLYASGTPAAGESWGPSDGSWALAKWRYGFTIAGAVNATALTVVAKQHEVIVVYGQTNGAHAKGASTTIDLYDGNNSSISQSITATNRFASVATAKKVMCTWIGGTWLTSAAEC
jgi:hypothetical protein